MKLAPALRAGRVLLLVLASTGVALLLSEGLARVFAPGWQPRRAERSLFWMYHPRLGWMHRPDTSGRFVGPSWDVDVQINSHGLRDVEHTYERLPGKKRALMLGDSIGWGFGVEQEHMVSSVLGRLCPSWEVVNASVSGYSTDQEYLWYQLEGRKYSPDLVLLLLHANDVPGNSVPRLYGYGKPRFLIVGGELQLTNVPVPERTFRERLYRWFIGRSYLANGVVASWQGAPGWFEPAGARQWMHEPLRTEVTWRLLSRFAADLREAGVDFCWVLLPMQKEQAAAFHAVARRVGVPVVDLNPRFAKAARSGRMLFLSRDEHWSAEGHRAAAAEIVRVLPGCSP
ncbi:MAG: SGNH/GDSL hydrolase family protein [Candidatus Krumholzibacteriia bacterium]